MNVFSAISWAALEETNARQCHEKSACHGYTSDGKEPAIALFKQAKSRPNLNLAEAVDILRQLHKLSPFLFFNGNTFAIAGNRLLAFYNPNRSANATTRSLVGHHIAGTNILALEELLALLPPSEEQVPDSKAQPTLERLVKLVASRAISLADATEQANTSLDIRKNIPNNLRELTEFELKRVLEGKSDIGSFLTILGKRIQQNPPQR